MHGIDGLSRINQSRLRVRMGAIVTIGRLHKISRQTVAGWV